MATKVLLQSADEGSLVGVLVPPGRVLVEDPIGDLVVLELERLDPSVTVTAIAPCREEPYPVSVDVGTGEATTPGLWWPSDGLVAFGTEPARPDRPVRAPRLVDDDEVFFVSPCELEEPEDAGGPNPLLLGLGILVIARALRGRR